MSNKQFMASISQWQGKTAKQMLAIAKQSTDDVIRIAQTPVSKGGLMPVDTSTLRNSLVAELNGAQVGEGADSYTLGIAGLQLGDVVTVAWTASYSIARHYKPPSFGQGGGYWRDNAAAQWQNIVRKNARRV